MRFMSTFLLLGAACQPQITQIETLLPQISVSNTDINFGDVEWGQTEYRTITIENQGELPMGIHPMALEAEGFETSLHYQAHNGLTVVAMGGYVTEEEARKALTNARGRGHEKAWLKRL